MNYYQTKIENVSSDMAAKILTRLAEHSKVRFFNYTMDELTYYTRGLVDIDDILREYSSDKDKVKIMDEFELAYQEMNKIEE